MDKILYMEQNQGETLDDAEVRAAKTLLDPKNADCVTVLIRRFEDNGQNTMSRKDASKVLMRRVKELEEKTARSYLTQELNKLMNLIANYGQELDSINSLLSEREPR